MQYTINTVRNVVCYDIMEEIFMEEKANMTKEERIAEAGNIAGEYFKQGLNCSECVLQSFLDTQNVNFPKEVISLASGFGGGMGQTRNTCGAITGAILALSTMKGRNPFEKETPKERIQQIQQIYVPFGDMVREIEQHQGTLICKELSAPYGDFAGKARKQNCKQIISYCAELVAKYAQENQSQQ